MTLRLVVLGLALASRPPRAAAAEPKRDLDAYAEHVVFIVVDGLAPRHVTAGNTPNLFGMRRRGAWASDSRSVQGGKTVSAIVSMLTGDPPEVHGIKSNLSKEEEIGNFQKALKLCTDHNRSFFGVAYEHGMDAAAVIGITPPPRAGLPGFFRRFIPGDLAPQMPSEYPAGPLDSLRSGLKDLLGEGVGLAGPKFFSLCAGLLNLDASSSLLAAAADENASLSSEVEKYAESILQKRILPAVIFLYFRDVDAMGHQYGWDTPARPSPRQISAVKSVDRIIGRVAGMIAARKDLSGSTLILVASDHGGGAVDPYGHFSNEPGDYNTTLIAYGPGIRKGTLPDTVFVWHINQAVLFALGIKPGPGWDNNPLRKIFAPKKSGSRFTDISGAEKRAGAALEKTASDLDRLSPR